MGTSTPQNAPTCAIVDDEESSRRNLLRLLDKQHPDLKVLGTADGVVMGIDLVKHLRPEFEKL